MRLRQKFQDGELTGEEKLRRSLSTGDDPLGAPPLEVPRDKRMVRQNKFSSPVPVARSTSRDTSNASALMEVVQTNSNPRNGAPPVGSVSPPPKESEGGFSYKPRAPDRSYSDTVSPEVLKSLSPEERSRQAVIFELINTELLFHRDLSILCDVGIAPLSYCLDTVPDGRL